MRHVVNGDSARGAVQAALAGAKVSACRDVLSVGPLDTHLDDEAFDALRLAFWRQVFGARPLPHDSPLSDVATLCREAAHVDGLVLWAGASASDQLFAAWVLDALYAARSDVDVRIVDLSADGHGVRGPAELMPEALAAVANPRPVSNDAWSAYRDLWRAIAAGLPDAWPGLAASGTLPAMLSITVRVMINRLPDRQRGLGRPDERLLSAAASRGATRRSVLREALAPGDAAWRDLDSDVVGDVWLDWRLERMAASELARPLLQFDGERVAPTAFGRDVLDGRANAVAVNGIDDDVGGVRLRRGAPVWFRDGDRVVRIADP